MFWCCKTSKNLAAKCVKNYLKVGFGDEFNMGLIEFLGSYWLSKICDRFIDMLAEM